MPSKHAVCLVVPALLPFSQPVTPPLMCPGRELLSSDARAMMEGLDARQQRFVAAALQELMESARQISESKAPGEEVTEEDVVGMFRQLSSEAARDKRRRMA